MILQIVALLISVFALVYFAYRGVSVLVLAPLLAMITAVMAGDFPGLTALSSHFMPAAAQYISIYFPVFLSGALFGKLMSASGSAERIAHWIVGRFGARRAVPAVFIATAVLTYGGVSLFIVVFAMYPIAAMLFREADIPKRLIPAVIAAGAFTFTMTGMPGSPQALNAMPTVYFNTGIYAGAVPGLAASAVMVVLSLWWLGRSARRAAARGEGYGTHREVELCEATDRLPPLRAAVLPLLLIFIFNALLDGLIFADVRVADRFGNSVNGTWPVIISISLTSCVMLVYLRRYLPSPLKLVREGAESSLIPTFNTASVVGYGGVVRALTSFALIKGALSAMRLPEVLKVGLSTGVISGIVGSASGGTAIALDLLAPEFLEMSVHPGTLHRILVLSSGVFDSLPHSGGIITLLAVTGLSHRESYADIAAVTIASPLLATGVAMAVAML